MLTVESLEVPRGIPVMAIERTYFAGRVAIETADAVVAADNYELTYDNPIRDE